MLNYQIKFYFSVFLFFISFNLTAQVTVGSDIVPSDGALLDMKERKGEDSSDKGLLLPRVALESSTSLMPCASNTQENLTSHKGLLVYNIREIGDSFPAGLSIWDGSKWNAIQDAWLKTGNSGTSETSDFLGTTDNKGLSIRTNNLERAKITNDGKVGIGTSAPKATLDVQGDLRIAITPSIEDAASLVIGDDGKIGKAVAAPARVAFLQSSGTQILTGTTAINSLNAGTPVVVAWRKDRDIITNNVIDYNVDNTFTIRMKGLYELSGYINYLVAAKVPDQYTTNVEEARAGVNVSIQVYEENNQGVKVWKDFTTARFNYAGTAVSSTTQTIVVPPGVKEFNAGDKIRMVFKRPTSAFGLPHGENAGIHLPNGAIYTKGMKVLALSID